MSNVEESLDQYLDQLQKEEKSLCVVLEQSSWPLKEQRGREKSRKEEEEAVAPLEDALMSEDSRSSSVKMRKTGDKKEIDDGCLQAHVDEDQEDCGDGKVVDV